MVIPRPAGAHASQDAVGQRVALSVGTQQVLHRRRGWWLALQPPVDFGSNGTLEVLCPHSIPKRLPSNTYFGIALVCCVGG